MLYYEVKCFEEIFRGGDRRDCDQFLEESLYAARIMERARKAAGIFFAADGEMDRSLLQKL